MTRWRQGVLRRMQPDQQALRRGLPEAAREHQQAVRELLLHRLDRIALERHQHQPQPQGIEMKDRAGQLRVPCLKFRQALARNVVDRRVAR